MDHKLIYYFRKWTDISDNDEGLILSAFEDAFIKKKKDLLVPDKVCKSLYQCFTAIEFNNVGFGS